MRLSYPLVAMSLPAHDAPWGAAHARRSRRRYCGGTSTSAGGSSWVKQTSRELHASWSPSWSGRTCPTRWSEPGVERVRPSRLARPRLRRVRRCGEADRHRIQCSHRRPRHREVSRGRQALKDLADVQELIRTATLPRALAEAVDPWVRDKFLELWDAIEKGRAEDPC